MVGPPPPRLPCRDVPWRRVPWQAWGFRFLSLLLSIALVAMPVELALADSITDAAGRGQAAGIAASLDPQTLFGQNSQGNTVVNAGSGQTTTIAPSQIVPGSGAVSASALSASGNNLVNRAQLGGVAQQSGAAGSDPSSIAYQTILQSHNRAIPNLNGDSVFNTSSDVIGNLTANSSLFGDCTTTVTYNQTSSTVHVPDYEECDRSFPTTSTLNLVHTYQNGVEITASGDAATAACGPGCINVTIGVSAGLGLTATTKYADCTGSIDAGCGAADGTCQIFSYHGSFTINNVAAITGASLSYAAYKDRAEVLLNNAMTWQSDTTGTFPPTYPGPVVNTYYDHTGRVIAVGYAPCDTNPGTKSPYTARPGINVLSAIQNAVAAGSSSVTIPFEMDISVGDYGGGFAQLTFLYDTTALVTETWTPPNDVAAALQVASTSTSCGTTFSCASGGMPPLDGNGCAQTASGSVCANQLTSATTLAIAGYGVSPLCQQVTVSEACSVSAGPLPCYTDYQGNQQCLQNPGNQSNNCASLQGNPACSYVTTQCIDTDPNGNCLVDVDTYDCGNDVNVNTGATSTKAITCLGPIRCMGTDCVSQTAESNSSFGQVATQLQAVEMTAGDGNCSDPSDPSTCAVFQGSPDQCKVAVGGYVNCCNHAVSVNLSDYMSMLFNIKSVNSAVLKLATDSPVRGAWEMVSSPIDSVGDLVNSAWSDVQSTFTSAANSVFEALAPNSGELISEGAGQFADATLSGALSGIEQTMTNNVAKWVANTFGEAPANLIFSEAPAASTSVGGVSGIASSAGGGPAFGADGSIAANGVQFGGAIIGDALVWVGAAYAVYSIATTLIKIIYACETEEYQLDTDRQLKECHYVGSYCPQDVLGLCIEREERYCCFNTPLARIIQEQVRPQLGLGWGSPQNPQCEGLSIAQFGQVDWSKVNLSEWEALLSLGNMVPNAASMTPASLTGSGSVLAIGQSRTDAVTRSVARLNQTNMSTVESQAQQQLQSTTGPLP